MIRFGFKQYLTGTESNQCASSCVEQHHFSLSSRIISEGCFVERESWWGEHQVEVRDTDIILYMQSTDCRDLNCKDTLRIFPVRAVDMVIILEKKQLLEKSLRCKEKDTALSEIFFLIYCPKKVNLLGVLWVIDWLPCTTDTIFMF